MYVGSRSGRLPWSALSVIRPNKEVKCHCFPCDSCTDLICLEYSGLSSSEIKCKPLQRRTLKFLCEKYRSYDDLAVILQSSVGDKKKIIQGQKEIIKLLKEKISRLEDLGGTAGARSYS